MRGITRTQGAVLHATSWAALIANWSTHIGIPTFTNLVRPYGLFRSPSKAEGSAYGISLKPLENRLSMKAVYFQTDSRRNTGSGGIDARYNQRNIRIADALQGPQVGPGSLTPLHNGAVPLEHRGSGFGRHVRPDGQRLRCAAYLVTGVFSR